MLILLIIHRCWWLRRESCQARIEKQHTGRKQISIFEYQSHEATQIITFIVALKEASLIQRITSEGRLKECQHCLASLALSCVPSSKNNQGSGIAALQLERGAKMHLI
jgi:hypothetical protein|mmetsp:Transcript_12916/g.39865  ORF Transcript_12916/g.39865 Transcript_12916/m.39865 type:complete len:108 (+) Transcript_12916:1262-1585(+)